MAVRMVGREEASEYLFRHRDQHLLHLGALSYDPLRTIVGLGPAGQLRAMALVVEHAGALPDPRPTVMAAAESEGALVELALAGDWPRRAVWTVGDPALLGALERELDTPHAPTRGLVFFGAQASGGAPLPLAAVPLGMDGVVVREIVEDDALSIDLSPCSLSPTALRGWLRRGWRMYGALCGGELLAHALAAYPVGEADEVAAVYTAGAARRRGLGAAVVRTTIEATRARGREAFYIASRGNLASRQLAERVGLRGIGETWEIVVG
jgi:GNAT superfamily N-acetyltransferase